MFNLIIILTDHKICLPLIINGDMLFHWQGVCILPKSDEHVHRRIDIRYLKQVVQVLNNQICSISV